MKIFDPIACGKDPDCQMMTYSHVDLDKNAQKSKNRIERKS